MKIEILYYIEGAKKAKGLTVIIDVIRSFTVDCYILNNGAARIIPMADIETAYKLKKENPEYILIGERNEQTPQGFDFGNSPSYFQNIDFKGKTIVQATGAGTKGIVNAKNVSEILTGSFVNINAIIKFIQKKNPEIVSLVSMGYAGSQPADEDILCAQYIKNSLEGIEPDFDQMVKIIKNGTGKRLFKPENQDHSPVADFYLCMNINAFNFIIKAYPYKNNLICLLKEDII